LRKENWLEALDDLVLLVVALVEAAEQVDALLAFEQIADDCEG